ncbi:hypothetical protein KSC_107600 [Ktedonobacter sp. SOSP1-52]|nr:hypothetical protein KSC_107600 [Ktedonobacter sp. SOSP1-52]
MLAIIGSLILQEYLAGTVIVLMMVGGIAHAWRQEQLVNIPAEEVEIGMHVVVKPGEMAPVDGLIISGMSSVSEADLTGEPLPVRKARGAMIFSGSVNLDGVLEVEATKRSAESKYAQIVRLVQEVELASVSDFEEVFGKGVHGTIMASPHEQPEIPITHDFPVAIGNRTFMRSLHIVLPEKLLAERSQRTEHGQIVSFLAVENQVVGLIVLEDIPRPDLAYLVPGLKQVGVRHTVLLTGDNETIAEQIGQAAKVDQIVARCLPEEKVRSIKQLLDASYKVLMVGDGVNDAPALASASVGLALGSQGLTAASSAADAILLSTDILRVVLAVKLGRHVMRVARQGIWIGIGLSFIAMVFQIYIFYEGQEKTLTHYRHLLCATIYLS